MTDIDVHTAISGRTVRAGTAHFTRSHGRVTTTFTYDTGYIGDPRAYPIDPRLPVVSGNQYLPRLPGAFADSAPDRWGRNLLARRERLAAAEERRTARGLDDVDYLVGVNDTTRQGALRYTEPGGDVWLSPHTDVPRLVQLPALLGASDLVDAGDDGADAYKLLLDAGTASLGGARPKAAVTLDDGSLGIAKFPHASDRWDVLAWEAVALDLADAAGVSTPSRQLVTVGDRHVLLVRRFDREGDDRVGYISAMTLLGAGDGDAGDYGDIIMELETQSGELLAADRRELYTRAALNVAVHNTDDHLRNHGLLAGRGGWRLSPIFDVNPDPELGEVRQTSIAGAVAVSDERDGLVALADDVGLPLVEAEDILERVAVAVGGWEGAAERAGVSDAERRRFAPMFEDRIAALVSGRRSARVAGGKPRSAGGRFASRRDVE